MESIFFLLLVVEAFSLQKVVEMLEGGSQLVRGQVNTEVETKPCCPIHSTFEALVVQRVVGCCRGKELSPLCSPVPAAGAAVHCASHPFAEHTSQM